MLDGGTIKAISKLMIPADLPQRPKAICQILSVITARLPCQLKLHCKEVNDNMNLKGSR